MSSTSWYQLSIGSRCLAPQMRTVSMNAMKRRLLLIGAISLLIMTIETGPFRRNMTNGVIGPFVNCRSIELISRVNPFV